MEKFGIVPLTNPRRCKMMIPRRDGGTGRRGSLLAALTALRASSQTAGETRAGSIPAPGTLFACAFLWRLHFEHVPYHFFERERDVRQEFRLFLFVDHSSP